MSKTPLIIADDKFYTPGNPYLRHGGIRPRQVGLSDAERREIINELRKELIEVLKAINGFQQKVKELVR